MTVADKILFTCTSCEYKARIPAHYSGRSIHCPKCKTIQEVGNLAVAGAESSSGLPAVTLDAPNPGEGKIVFTCPDCSYKGRLSAEYDGKTIRCPGCQKPQQVQGEPVPSPIVASLAADETVFRTGEMEKIRFECGACGYRARIPGKYAGKPIHCPQCKEVQQVNPDTDLESATGRTVVISKVSQAEVREARLAVTNIGVAFTCAVCGYASKISPSCAGDAIYCPSCRSPQKVEWGDPDEEEAEAPAPEPEAEAPSSEPAPPVAPASATAFSMDIASERSPAAVPVLPIAPISLDDEPAPAAKAEEPEEPSSDREADPEVPAAEDAGDPTGGGAAAPAAARPNRGAPRRPARGPSPEQQDEPPASAPARASRAAPEPVASQPASKLPLLLVGILFLVAAGLAGWLFAVKGGLDQRIATLEDDLAAQKTATAAAMGERDDEKTRADGLDTTLTETRAALAAAEAKVENLTTTVTEKTTELADQAKALEAKAAELATARAEIERLTTMIEDAKKALPLPR